MTRRRTSAAALAAVLLTAAAPAAAAEPRAIEPAFAVENEIVAASFDIPAILDAELKGRIPSGLTNRIIVSAWIESADGQWRGHDSLVSLQAVYDVWGEAYTLLRDDTRGPTRKAVKDQAAFLDTLVHIDAVPLAARSVLEPGRQYVVRVTASVNPPSKELIEKAREYLSDPEGFKRLSTSRTAFGSFARTFIPAAIGEAGSVYQFVSKPFSPAALPAERAAAPPAPTGGTK